MTIGTAKMIYNENDRGDSFFPDDNRMPTIEVENINSIDRKFLIRAYFGSGYSIDDNGKPFSIKGDIKVSGNKHVMNINVKDLYSSKVIKVAYKDLQAYKKYGKDSLFDSVKIIRLKGKGSAYSLDNVIAIETPIDERRAMELASKGVSRYLIKKLKGEL